MIDSNYNQKFRNFFSKFEKEYSNLSDKEEKDFLWNVTVDFVEKNRDFVMQYPIIQYWSDIEKNEYDNIKKYLLSSYNGKNINLYFHIPFCKTKCSYCNFHIIIWDAHKKTMQKIYIQKLKKEIDEFLSYNNDFSIDTIFIWWGTPSYIDDDILEDLLKYIKEKLWKFMSDKVEFSFECNPDSLTKEKIIILKKYSVNRISIGVQSFDDTIIKNINRTYTKENVFLVLKTLNENGFKNINIDMIYWLPWSDYTSNKKDLEIISSLDISHITYYPLYNYENAILTKTGKAENKISEIYNFYDEIIDLLEKKWFNQYGREYFSRDWQIHHYQNNYVSNKLLYWFWHSAYSFNWEYAFYKNQNLREYLTKNEIIDKTYKYDAENLDRRLFVLGSRNITIKKEKIINTTKLEKNIKLWIKLWLIKEDKWDIILTRNGLKYQEIVAHMFV